MRKKRVPVSKKIARNEQVKMCRFYDKEKSLCKITKSGELICDVKRCSLFVGEENDNG